MTRLCAAVIASALLLAACAHTEGGKLQEAKQARISVIAVYPFGFRWDTPAYRSFELTGRLIDEVLHQSEFQTLVYGPGEFRLYQPDDDNIYAASTLGALLPQIQRRPEELVVLRPWAERRVQSSSRSLVNAAGKTLGQEQTEEVTYVGHVDVIHARTQQRIGELSGEVEADPFAVREDDGADPTPELTALMRSLTREAMAQLRPQLRPAGTFSPLRGLSLDVTPHLSFAYSEPGRPAYDAAVAKMDPLDREVFVTARVRFANPQLSPEQAAKLAKLPGGLHVHVPTPTAPLQAGDVILQVNGEPAHPQTLIRARILAGPDSLKIRRASGDYEVVVLP